MISGDEIEILRAWADSEPLISEMHAFGSRVGGYENEESDLDVAVTLDLPNHELHQNWFKNEGAWARQLSEVIGYPVHLIALNTDIRPPDFNPEVFDAAPKMLVYRKDG